MTSITTASRTHDHGGQAFAGSVQRLYLPSQFPADGVGGRASLYHPLVFQTADLVADDTTSTATLTVDAPSVISTIDTIGDQDFYRVDLVEGQSYQIGMYGYTGGPGLLPLADSYVEIYDAQGNLVASGDGGADTPLNSVNSGFDVLMTFNATATGTYFVNARAFDNIPNDGTHGDLVGDYELFVRHAPEGAYQPYYDPDSPLYAIDWGTQVDGTVRNPDGADGPRPTGNPAGTPADNEFSVAGSNVITIYFARPGDVFVSNDLTNPGLPPAIVAVGAQDFERQAVFTALNQFSSVADIQYVEVDNREDANFFYVTYSGTPGPGVSLLGSMSPPQESDEGLAQFNSGDYRWTATNLAQGGFSFVTLIHEFGHGHGLAHPHDNGGHSGIMNGVESEGVVADYTLGDYDLNQSVFTMMSYEDGWQTSPYGNAPTDVGYGYLGSLMAFDVAAIQDAYGVNETYHTGGDVYTLSDVNAAGTFYSCIWDAGGTDEIRYDGARDANIDLRAATLRYEYGGGGWVSYATGIYGGFTIANAVTIENATGGGGNDHLTGNGADNVLRGGLGDDIIDGGAGNDVGVFAGSRSAYTITGAGGSIVVAGADGADTLTGIEILRFDDGDYVRAPSFSPASLALRAFGADSSAGGWADDRTYPRTLGDVNGDGLDDLVGFGSNGVFVSLADGSGGFGAMTRVTGTFGQGGEAGGWADNANYPRTMADVNGDGRADIVGFGYAGVYVSLANAGGGFDGIALATGAFGAGPEAGGWASTATQPRMLADVDGDGLDDLVGFGADGVHIAVASGNGQFGAETLASGSFGSAAAAGGWSDNDLYTRTMADINGDGMADLVGFGSAGVFAALATGNGAFGSTYQATSSFGAAEAAGGWTSNDHYYRTMADFDGDGVDDIVGFGYDGVYVATGDGSGHFGDARLVSSTFGTSASAGGWSSYHEFPRLLGESDGDGAADIIAFGYAGVYVATAGDGAWTHV